MKKVRISKKNPNRILKAIETRISPSKQLERVTQSIKNSLRIEDFRHFHEHQISKLSHQDNIIHSHRYKASEHSLESDRKRESYSPREIINHKSQDKEKKQEMKYRRPRGLRDLVHRSTDKSPYLERNLQNKSERKLIISNRNLTQIGRNVIKQLKSVRFNSLQEKSSSLQIKKTSEDILKEARKLMLAGQSRKSMYILKPILAKDPTNLAAINIAALNLFNIGDFAKSAEYLDHLLQLKKDFSPNAYFLRAKIYMKLNTDIDQSLSKLEECQKFFPNNEHVHLEKGQIYMSINSFQQALENFKLAEKLAPKSLQVQQSIIMAYLGLKQNLKALQLIQRVCKHSPNATTTKRFMQLKQRILFELQKYQQIISINEKNESNDPAVLYYYGYALYKTNNLLKSYLILETSLANSENCTKPIKLMLLILCMGNDFYQAYHVVQRCQHLNVDKNQMKCQLNFIQGTVCLMKRNTFEGVQKLNVAKETLQQKQDEFSAYISRVINMFIAYGYFCLGNYEKSQVHYECQKQSFPGIKFEGMDYNVKLNEGFLLYQKGKLKEALAIFEKLDCKKMEPNFCQAIINVNLYFRIKQEERIQNIQFLQKAKEIFKKSANLVSKFNNNIGANYLYHKSVLHSYMGEWKDAIFHIDEAIEKSEENYWRYYYVRALGMACIHNFSEAINDCTAAINLKDSEASPFYLRACCFQIQGEGNYAFKDLQSYLVLKPQDKQIHKFAGKLLFQNGAFEDAISAFNHYEIPETLQNEDAYLTKSKTYFLLGRFLEAGQEMRRVYKINQARKQALFDGQMMVIVDQLLDSNRDYDKIIEKIDQLYEQKGFAFAKSQVFKKTQNHTLKSICYFYTNRYHEAIGELQKAIIVKQKTIVKQSLIQGSTREDEKDTRLYICQMNFNISLCYLMLGDLHNAKLYAQKLNFNSNDVFYQPHQRYISLLYAKTRPPIGQQLQMTRIQIFPSRNKISNFLQQVYTKIQGHTIYTKLCIPFPKVQPPQIFPKFDPKLLEEFTIQRIQRKSEAPWICKQENAIKFTSKMQKYSRLEIEESATENSMTDQIDIDNSHMSMESIMSRRSKGNIGKLGDNTLSMGANRKKVYM